MNHFENFAVLKSVTYNLLNNFRTNLPHGRVDWYKDFGTLSRKVHRELNIFISNSNWDTKMEKNKKYIIINLKIYHCI